MDTVADRPVEINDLACFMVDDSFYEANTLLGIEVIKRSQFTPEKYEVVVAVADCSLRERMVASLPEHTRFKTIIHPSVIKSDFVEIGEGSIITAGCILTCNIILGKHCHLNLKTTVGHDVQIGDFFTTAPAVNISGNSIIGNKVFIGTNSCIKEKISICDGTLVGMGAVVVKSIFEKGIYAGNPAKIIRK
jgi:sugar O-acyltransferase (sialic acid O-acetyltransferase NeuD family)